MTASVIRSPLLLAALVGAVILALAPSASQAQQTPAKKAHAAQTAEGWQGREGVQGEAPVHR
jgi:hypothetical protein